jgi:hypothetical protein
MSKRSKRAANLRAATLLLAGALAMSGAAHAAEATWALRGGVRYSDNVDRQPEGSETSATALITGLDLRGFRDTGRLRYQAATNLARAGMQYHIAPETFVWNAGVTYEQLREDLAEAISPGNREGLLGLTTGPSLRLRLGGPAEAQMDASIARADYENRPFDNQTLQGRVLLGRRANPRSRVALGASWADVNYLSSLPALAALDFRRREAFLRLELEGVRTQVQIEGGYGEAKGRLVDDSGPMLRASLSRRLTPSINGFVNVFREYPTSDPAAAELDSLATQASSQSGADVTAGPRLSQSGQLGLRYERQRTGLSLAYALREEKTVSGPAQSRDLGELRLSVDRRLTPATSGSIYLVRSDEKFSPGSQDIGQNIFGASLTYALGRSVGLELQGEFRDRKVQPGSVKDQELTGGLFITYSRSRGTAGR